MTPGIAFAMQAGSKPLLTLDNISLAWPVYHRLSFFDGMPEAGDPVVLERDVAHPSGERGISVTTSAGETLGYVTNQHFAALDWALKRAGAVDARISEVNLAVVNGKRVPGWGAFRIDTKIYEQRGLV
jgi:hypothetical protein